MRKAVFTFELGAPHNRAVLAALGPETSRDVPRASARVSSDGPVLKLEIVAEDSASLRAAVNSYLRWVKLAAGAAQAGSEARRLRSPSKPVGGQGGKKRNADRKK